MTIRFATEYWPETESSVEFFPATVAPNLPVTAVKIYVIQDYENYTKQIPAD